MKLFAALMVMCLSMATAIAQFEGKIIMKVEVSKLPAELESLRSMMETTSTVFIKNAKTRIESYTDMSGMNITITDAKNNKAITCTDMTGDKLAFETTYEQHIADAEGTSVTGFKALTGTKKIAGYNCSNGIYTIEEEGEKQEIEVWYTKEIQNAFGEMKEVPGFVMEMTFSEGDISLKYFASEIVKQKVADTMFERPSDYKLISEEEMNQLMMEGE